LKDTVVVEQELQRSPAFTGFSGTEIWAEIQLPTGLEGDEEVDFKVKDLHFIFKTVAKIMEISDAEEEDVKLESPITEITEVITEKSRESKQK
jgi:hypothetical protein